MHAKMLVVDDAQVLIGGMNWGPRSVENTDADVYTQGNIAHEAQSVFESDWRTMGSTIPNNVTNESTQAQDILTGKPLQRAILSTLDHAQTIQAALFELSNRSLINELCKRSEAGAKVQVVLDSRMEKSINKRAANTLKKAGVEVEFYPGDQVLHEKMLIADNTVIIGSANYSYNAFLRNHELDLISNDTHVVSQAKTDFLAICD
jgi:cardiolipin synthase